MEVDLSVKEQLACSLGRKDEVPNIALAEKISEASDKRAVKELTVLIQDKKAAVRHDTIKVIYPELAMFDFGKDQIKPGVKPTFTRFATILKAHPEIRILVNGYTDNVGAEDQNIDLSLRRAVNAYNLLSENGVDATRMSTAGFGPQDPMRSNNTEPGRAANRRVEFKLYRPKT